ncbi:hypothetical protein G8759_24965 [Spirosoma aureum]|uniref:Uncharacterized protein n=1 Tax=Spirosoma aureum TaxID=2692134 RepID=A0A6G9ATJ8_9BACT|nr:hypothetical protein [Spirosoma aureum]QIP15649.1 hypothetical protein G8759_24965 [Spirosoma aureum]
MRLTWTFYPKSQPSVTLSVVYLPQLDAVKTPGYLEIESNTAYVSWDSFRIFNNGSQTEKRSLFGSLTRVDHFNPLAP